MDNLSISRRQFLKYNLVTAMSMLPVFELTLNAATANDYKALVCIYLSGGNDAFNMLIRNDTSGYKNYRNIRGSLAIPKTQLLPLKGSGVAKYGVHPSLKNTQKLFNTNELGFIGNIGSLLKPVSKETYSKNNVPYNLFAHNTQRDFWMSAENSLKKDLGWASKICDKIAKDSPYTKTSLHGIKLWQQGGSTSCFHSKGGIKDISKYNKYNSFHGYEFKEVYQDIINSNTHQNILVNEYKNNQKNMLNYQNELSKALEFAPSFNIKFNSNESLSSQLENVAKMISVRNHLNITPNRQTFYVELGGWDTHGQQLSDQKKLLTKLDNALYTFNKALKQLGVSNNVTTFTMSEFGRNLIPNGTGTDHGWGSHAIVMGGAVKGGRIYGKMPNIAKGSKDYIENGRVIPTTSVDQYGATLAKWFGVQENELNSIFPNLKNFSKRNLGFMA